GAEAYALAASAPQPDDRFQQPVARLGERDQPGLVDQPHDAGASAGYRDSMRGATALLGPEPHLREEPRQRLLELHQRVGIGLSDVEGSDPGSPQPLTVGVAEIRDQAAHVGSRGAFDQELTPIAIAAQLFEAVHLDLALCELHLDP